MKFKKGFELSDKPQGEMLDIEWLPPETDTVSANKESFKDLDINTMTNLKPEYKRKLETIIKAIK